MVSVPDYYALLGVHPTTEDFVIRLAHKARRQDLQNSQWASQQELYARLEELREAADILTDPERSAAYYIASGGEKNHERKMVVELDIFDNLFSEVQRKLGVAAAKRHAAMSELQRLELSRRVLASESIMTFYAEEKALYAELCNRAQNRSEIQKLFHFREHSDIQIRKGAHETRLLILFKDWAALDITKDVLESSNIWISSERNKLNALSKIGVRRTTLWLERTRSEIRRQLSNSICSKYDDLWTDAPLTFGDAAEFWELDVLLYKARFSIARAEYRPDEIKDT